jgi:hypothetical protein
MANPFASQSHTSSRKKMGNISGSPANFESPADKADRFASISHPKHGGPMTPPSQPDRMDFQSGGKVMKEGDCT